MDKLLKFCRYQVFGVSFVAFNPHDPVFNEKATFNNKIVAMSIRLTAIPLCWGCSKDNTYIKNNTAKTENHKTIIILLPKLKKLNHWKMLNINISSVHMFGS